MKRIDASPFAKFLLAFTIFALIVGGWMLAMRFRAQSEPLPGEEDGQDQCTLWFVGSSSMHRWTTLERDMAPWRAVNRGIDGATMDVILPRFANVKPAEGRPQAIILYVGENDLADGIGVRIVLNRVARFFDLRDRLLPSVPVFFLSAKPSPGRAAIRTQQSIYNDAARRFLPHMQKAYYVDITTPLLTDGKTGDNYREDGVHMNEKGYRIWADVVRRDLRTMLPRAIIDQCDTRRRR